MPTWAIVLLVIVGVVLLFAVIIAGMYNSLVKLNTRVDEAWSDITVQLKRRADLIPNLVSTVKGYAKHESDAIKQVSDARAKMMGARSVASTAEADRSMLGALSRIMAISESYPDLKADKNFQQLSTELTDTEDKVQASRRFYNAGVKELNTKISIFPYNILFHSFKKRDFYNVEESEYKAGTKSLAYAVLYTVETYGEHGKECYRTSPGQLVHSDETEYDRESYHNSALNEHFDVSLFHKKPPDKILARICQIRAELHSSFLSLLTDRFKGCDLNCTGQYPCLCCFYTVCVVEFELLYSLFSHLVFEYLTCCIHRETVNEVHIFGHLCFAIRARQKSLISCSVAVSPSWRMMQAIISSP